MSQNVNTAVTSSLLMHTEILTSRLATVPLGMSKRVLLISALSGPSSNGGALARQSLMLNGAGEQLVCGWVDFAAAVAEVRDFITVKKSYEARFRKPFDVQEAEYRGWLQKLLMVLKELGVRCDVTGDELASAATDPAVSRPGFGAPAPHEKSSLVPVLIIGALTLAGIALAVALLTF